MQLHHFGFYNAYFLVSYESEPHLWYPILHAHLHVYSISFLT